MKYTDMNAAEMVAFATKWLLRGGNDAAQSLRDEPTNTDLKRAFVGFDGDADARAEAERNYRHGWRNVAEARRITGLSGATG